MRLIVGLCVLVAIAGCAGHATAPASTSTTPLAVAKSAVAAAKPKPTVTPLSFYASQYLRIIAPLNAELATLSNIANPTQAQLDEMASKIEVADTALLRAPWPSTKAQSDIETLVRADGALIGDLQQNDGPNASRDAGTTTADAQIVRADLGLPPVRTVSS